MDGERSDSTQLSGARRDKRPETGWVGVASCAMALAALYWLAQSALHVLVVREGSFLQQLYAPSVHDLANRVSVLVVLGLAASGVLIYRRRHARVEAQLRASERRYRAFFTESRDAIYITSPDGRFLDMNQAGVELLGYSREELLRLRTVDLYADPGLREHFAGELQTRGFVREYELDLRHRSGRTIKVMVTASLCQGAHGEAPAYHSIARDITAQRCAEEALRRSEERYRQLYEQTPAMLHSIDRRSRLISVSSLWLEKLGYRREEVLGRPLTDFLTEQSARYAVEIVLPAFFRSGTCRDVHYEMRARDGRVLRVLVSAVGERNSVGEVVQSLAVLRDITRQAVAEREKARLEGELRHAQKVEAVGTLASGVAHDFNNSLTAILGYTGLARSTLPAGHPMLQSLEMIEQAARQAAGVTRALLTFSRKAPSDRQSVELTALVQESMRFLRRMLPASIETELVLEMSREVWVHADATQLQQVLLNLAINARDAMPEGGKLRVALETAAATADQPASAILIVEDTGVGMDLETKARVFEPFFTTKPREQGTGLGMAVIHGIVADHGGEIEVDSAVERGTTVRVRLPMGHEAPAPDEPRRADQPQAGRGEVVVVVEDDVHVRSIMSSTLQAAGYRVVQAGDGMAALQVLDEGDVQVALMVLDLDLPRMGGLACLAQVRRRLAELPVIIITGDVAFDPAAHLDERERLLRKPFRMSELTAAVAERLEARVEGVPI